MTKLDDALAGVTWLGFDTAPVIYFIEANPKYDALVTEIFQRITNGVMHGLTSVITLSEVLVQPIFKQQVLLQQEYRDLLLRGMNFETFPVSTGIAERAAELRAQYRLHTRCTATCHCHRGWWPSLSHQ
jgi:predicted nucleic acid-binding protein